MKLEIELDLNKLDYDSINTQITQKIAQMNISESYDLESKIAATISNTVQNKVEEAYNQYLDRCWCGYTTEGRNLIERTTRETIERRVNEIMKKIFSEDYDEDHLRNIMLDMLPRVFTSVVFSRMENALFSKECNYTEMVHNMILAEVDAVFNRARY